MDGRDNVSRFLWCTSWHVWSELGLMLQAHSLPRAEVPARMAEVQCLDDSKEDEGGLYRILDQEKGRHNEL